VELLRDSNIEHGESILTEGERKVSDFDEIKREVKFGVQTLESYQAYTELAGSSKADELEKSI
jgi:hypothetical protein